MKPRMQTEPTFRGKPRCQSCGDSLHPLANGWGHDKDNMATCIEETQRTGRIVRGEPR